MQISVNKWILNLSNVKVPDNIKYLLSLGPKFSILNKYLRTFNIKSIEKGIYHLDNNSKNIIRSNKLKLFKMSV